MLRIGDLGLGGYRRSKSLQGYQPPGLASDTSVCTTTIKAKFGEQTGVGLSPAGPLTYETMAPGEPSDRIA
jgi:hypothetical protein